MRLLLIAALGFFLTACEDDRVCSLDQSGFFQVKCWGTCPIASDTCSLRWRLKGSVEPWVTDGTNYRDRDKERDAELEYACYCK